MCGFSGCFFLKKNSFKGRFNPINLAHRGPDDFQKFRNDFIKVNFYRLKILGGKYGKQPMISENKRWMLVFNGEIYNYIELAKEISRSDLVKKGDARVLIELIALKGLKSIKKTNGMFSIALFDLKKKKIFLIRDRFGIKPLYYTIKKDIIFFASEIKSLPISENNKIDKKNINNFLSSELYPKSPKTFYKNIFEIKPGTINEFSKNKLITKRYYSLMNNLKKLENKKINLEDFEKALENSIRIRLRSDVPISLHFSGGLDSTALICKLIEMYGNKIPLELFILKYQNKLNPDLIRARKICKYLKLKLNEINFKNSDLKKLSKETQFQMDEPFGGVPVIGMTLLNKIQRTKFPVSIEGQGSDEIFSGYYTHLVMAMRDMIKNNKDKNILLKLKKNYQITNEKILDLSDELLKNNFGGSTDASKITFSKRKINFKDNFLRSIENFNIHINKLPRVLRFHDRISAGNSRELRFPYLDHNVIEIALSLSNEDKFKLGFPKYPLHKIIKRRLPLKLFLNKKRSALVPELAIINSNKKWCLNIFNKLKSKKIVPHKYFEVAINSLNKKKTNSFHIWQLINLHLFYSHYKKLKK